MAVEISDLLIGLGLGVAGTMLLTRRRRNPIEAAPADRPAFRRTIEQRLQNHYGVDARGAHRIAVKNAGYITRAFNRGVAADRVAMVLFGATERRRKTKTMKVDEAPAAAENPISTEQMLITAGAVGLLGVGAYFAFRSSAPALAMSTPNFTPDPNAVLYV